MLSRNPAARAAVEHNFIAACGGRAPRKSAGTSEKLPEGAPSDGQDKNAYVRWTDAEEKTLTALYRGGVTVSEIARRMERKSGGIRSRLKKLGLVTADAK